MKMIHHPRTTGPERGVRRTFTGPGTGSVSFRFDTAAGEVAFGAARMAGVPLAAAIAKGKAADERAKA